LANFEITPLKIGVDKYLDMLWYGDTKHVLKTAINHHSNQRTTYSHTMGAYDVKSPGVEGTHS